MTFFHSTSGAVIAAASLAVWLLASCGTQVSGPVPVSGSITGIVSAPAADSAQFARAGSQGGGGTWLIPGFVSTAVADVSGLEPVGNATVELVRLDSEGNVQEVLDSTTSSSSGAYTFTDTPPPDSTLAVRVTGQTDTMRAFVTGPQVDISPISEVVTDTTINTLAGAPLLEDFELEEIDSLSFLTEGMDIDVSGQTFGESVTTIKDASTPILPDMADGYSAPGMETVLHTKGYGAIEFSPVLKDPFTLGSGGVEARTRAGGWGFGIDDWIQDGSLFEGAALHDLTGVGLPLNDFIDVSGVPHVVGATRKVTVGGAGGRAVGGAVAAQGDVLAYPVDDVALGALGRGLRLAVKKSNVDVTLEPDNTTTTVLDNTLLDASGGAGTTYNMVQLRETVSGLVSRAGANAVDVTTATGTLTFDSDIQTDLNGSLYGDMSSGTLATSPLTVDVDSYAVTSGPAGSDLLPGLYRVFPDGGLLLREPDGGFLGTGFSTGDGRLVAFSSGSDIFQTELGVLGNDSDAAGDTLTIIDATQPAGGSVAIAENGDRLLYTPRGNDTTGESFSYTVQDAGGLTDSTTVSLSLINVNAAPAGNPDSYTVNADSVDVVLDVLGNDGDAAGETLTVSNVTQPANGTVTNNGDSVSYTPAAGYTGTDAFTYTVQDDAGLSDGPIDVDLSVEANAAPAGNADSYTVNTDSVDVVLDVLANDVDATGDTLTIVSVTQPSNGTVTTGGSTVVYTPAAGFTGQDSFTYSVEDSAGLGDGPVTVDLSVEGNTAPVAGSDGFDVNVDNMAGRTMTVAVRQASSLTDADLAGTYNAVQHASYFAEVGSPPTSATADVGFKYGSLTFDGAGGVSGGSLLRQRARLDIAVAKDGTSDALTALPTPATPEAPTGSYTVNGDGTLSLSLSIGTETVTGTGAVSQDGELVVLALETNDPDVNDGRGLLFLIRQP